MVYYGATARQPGQREPTLAPMERRVSVNLRLTPEMHAELKRIAATEERPLNTQIVRFLRRALEQYQAEYPERREPNQSE